MEVEGWLFDAYIKDNKVILWIKNRKGKTLKLVDSYLPDFYVKPKIDENLEYLQQQILEHPNIVSVTMEEKYTSINSRKKSKVLHVYADSLAGFKKAIEDLQNVKEVGEFFNLDLLHIQRYLFNKGLQPLTKTKFKVKDGNRLKSFRLLNDEKEIYPPPLTYLPFKIFIKSLSLAPNPNQDPIEKIEVYDENFNLEKELFGDEKQIIEEFEHLINLKNPDFLVAPEIEEVTLPYLLERSKILGVNLNLGREIDVEKSNCQRFLAGRIPLNFSTFQELGVCGIVEKSRFTMVPPRFAAEWMAGKTIDSRQCYEALKRDILIPKSKGFFKFVKTAKEILFRDKGGLILSPKVGIHENVAECDFESMFPNIIIHFNLSYETVTPHGINKSKKGFLSELTKKFLERRLYFKHLKKKFALGSREWFYCEQRQLALKMVLVCIYGYSGCFANRFSNVTLYEEINRIARETLIKTINIARNLGFEIIYADTDSIFVKKHDAKKEDYEKLCEIIRKETGLPISLDHHYKFLVLLPQETDPEIEATRRYFGKLFNGEIVYRGIELRRHDYPKYLKQFQEKLIEILFDTDNLEEIKNRKYREAVNFVINAYEQLIEGKIKTENLIISKILRKPINEYRHMFPHVCAAIHSTQKGKKPAIGETINFVYVNTEHPNPLRRVMLAEMLNGNHHYYDREKYVELLLDVAETILGWNGFNRIGLGFKPKMKNFIDEINNEKREEQFFEILNS